MENSPIIKTALSETQEVFSCVWGTFEIKFNTDIAITRLQDYHHIKKLQENTYLKIEVIDAKKEFYDALKGVDDSSRRAVRPNAVVACVGNI